MSHIQLSLRLLVLTLLLSPTSMCETIIGFVTDVQGAGQFTVGGGQIVLTAKTECEIGTVYGIAVIPAIGAGTPPAYYQLRPHTHPRFASMKTSRSPCATTHIVVGTRVRVVGRKLISGRLTADAIYVYQIMGPQRLNGTATLETVPGRVDSKTSHVPLWIDGYKIEITPDTRIELSSGRKLVTAEHLRTNQLITYAATRNSNGFSEATALLIHDGTSGAKRRNRLGIPGARTEPQNCELLTSGNNQSVQLNRESPIEVLRCSAVTSFRPDDNSILVSGVISIL